MPRKCEIPIHGHRSLETNNEYAQTLLISDWPHSIENVGVAVLYTCICVCVFFYMWRMIVYTTNYFNLVRIINFHEGTEGIKVALLFIYFWLDGSGWLTSRSSCHCGGGWLSGTDGCEILATTGIRFLSESQCRLRYPDLSSLKRRGVKCIQYWNARERNKGKWKSKVILLVNKPDILWGNEILFRVRERALIKSVRSQKVLFLHELFDYMTKLILKLL